MTESSRRPISRRTTVGCLGVVIVVAVAGTLTHWGASGAAWRSHLQPGGLTAATASSLRVAWTVQNTGSAPGDPSCLVTVTDRGGTQIGTDTETLTHPVIAPGHQEPMVDTVALSAPEADRIAASGVSVTCS